VTDSILAARAPQPYTDVMERYVPRPELEDELNFFARKPVSSAGKYMAVTGARG
jgi:hypothetical protein